MRVFFALVASVLVLAYPFVIYTNVQNLSPAAFGIVLFVICLIKLYFSPEKLLAPPNLVLAAMIALCAVAALTNSLFLLRLYPVGMSLGMGLIFLLSLKDKESAIERMAILAGKKISPQAKNYTRKLTLVWASVLIANSLVALYLAVFSSLKLWALYCGFLVYIIFALIFAVEFVYRQYYIKKYGT